MVREIRNFYLVTPQVRKIRPVILLLSQRYLFQRWRQKLIQSNMFYIRLKTKGNWVQKSLSISLKNRDPIYSAKAWFSFMLTFGHIWQFIASLLSLEFSWDEDLRFKRWESESFVDLFKSNTSLAPWLICLYHKIFVKLLVVFGTW